MDFLDKAVIIDAMKIVIAEKPSVARDLARVLKVSQKREGYFEGNGYQISWAFGHLVRLLDAQGYDPAYEKWNLESLPIVPEPFRTEVSPEAKRQFDVIAGLLCGAEVESVVCATDAGREGELIFRHIYQLSGCDKPIQRLWISSQTDQAIKEGFEKLRDGAAYESLYDSALSRSEADWLVGINATRGYTKRFGYGQGVMSVGRVQTPVLKLIVDRFVANRDFVPETYFEVHVKVKHENGTFPAVWFLDKESRLMDGKVADQIVADVKQAGTGIIKKVSIKQQTEQPPLLYDLTELQKDANRKFKFSADKTLQTMQALYETHKILSYPRTSSRYLSADLKAKIPGLIKNLAEAGIFEGVSRGLLTQDLGKPNRLFDDKKVTDHHAIIPTDKRPDLSVLSKDERLIYDMVVKRFLAGFMPNCEKELTEIVSGFSEHVFKSNGTVIRLWGWRDIYRGDEDEDDSKSKDSAGLLPIVAENDGVIPQDIKAMKKQTKAPLLYTEATILGAMETAGKAIEDEELRQAMKECGLGTPATRAQILERLIKVQYIFRQKNLLVPTDKGIQLIGVVQDKALLSAELTGDWEKKLNQIVQGTYSRMLFMEEIRTFTRSMIENLKQCKVARPIAAENSLGKCPVCKIGEVVESKMAYGCNQWRQTGCKFAIWKEIAKKKISEPMAKALLKNGKTQVLKGFTTSTGKEFEAALVLDPATGRVGFGK